MSAFFSLFVNLLPLYALIGTGYIASRFLDVDRQSLGTLAIYIFVPVVVFGFIARIEFQPSYILLPIFFYVASVAIGLGFYALGRRIYSDSQANLMALCASMGNTGYFGLPLVLLYFDEATVAIYIFMMVGGSMYEATIGYYIAARGNFSVRESLIKLAKFPAIYAILAGFAVKAIDVELPSLFWDYWGYFKGAYIVIGMMIVGAALAKIEKFEFGPRFLAMAFAGKFIFFPLLAFGFILLDQHVLGWLTKDVHHLIMMITIVPPAANIAAFALQMNMQPEKAATTILIGTVFALIYIPYMIWLIGI